MELRSIANTDIKISAIGLGTVKFGRNRGVKYPNAFDLPTDDEVRLLLNLCIDLGINLLDTAPAYGSSEERIGKLLPGSREQWILCSKAGETFENDHSSFDFSAAAIIRSVERSLKRLKTDYLDCVLIHSDGQDEKIILEDGALETLNHLKKQGKIRATGMSSKTVAGGLLALTQADIVMTSYHPYYLDEKPVLDRALELNKAIFIKKALQSGHFIHNAKPLSVQKQLQFILQHPAVTSIIVGTLNPKHLKEIACDKLRVL